MTPSCSLVDRLDDAGRAPPLVAHLHHPLVLAGGRDQQLAFPGVVAARLLDVDVLAGGAGRGSWPARASGCGASQTSASTSLSSRILRKSVIACGRWVPLFSSFALACVGPLGVDVADVLDDHAGLLFQRGDDLHAAVQAHDADGHLLAGQRIGLSEQRPGRQGGRGPGGCPRKSRRETGGKVIGESPRSGASREGSGQDVVHHPAVDVGQAEVAAGVAVGQPLVVEAEQVQDRGVQVVDSAPCPRPRRSRTRRSRRRRCPPLTPPPASQIVKPSGLWSRPSFPSAYGVRPNSPPQTTSVSSSSPRAFRSVSRPAIGWSTARAIFVVPAHEVLVLVPQVAGGDLDEPHAGLGEPAGQQALPAEVVGLRRRRCRTACASPPTRPARSSTPAPPSACGTPARTTRSALELRVVARTVRRCSRFSCWSRSSCRRCIAGDSVVVGEEGDRRVLRPGRRPCRSACPGRWPAGTRSSSSARRRGPAAGQIVMKPGRLLFSVPRP